MAGEGGRKGRGKGMKGQLFLVAVVFLVGMIFVVQQALFQYSSVDISKAFEDRNGDLFGNMVEVVNKTITETYYCNDTKDSFQNRLEDIKTAFLEEQGVEYAVEITYALDCSKWLNSPPNPAPLRATLSVTGRGSDTRGTFLLYHKQ